MTTLLRDVIDIPERVGSDDYVLRLTDSTGDDQRIAAALDEYVITDSLRDNFFAAIDLVSDALARNTSRAAYLTGSFGSGKSHFMAVLYALLGNHPAVRTSKFQDLTGHYDGQLSGKKILRLTYHLLGAKSLEQAVFRGYVEQITRLHPDAPLPAVHLSDKLLADAENMRAQMADDDKFLAGLGSGSGVGDEWAASSAVAGTCRDTRRPCRLTRRPRTARPGVRAGRQLLQIVRRDRRLRRPRPRPRRHLRTRQIAGLRRRRAVPRRTGAVVGVLGARHRVLRPRIAEDHQARRVVGPQPCNPVDLLHLPPDGPAQVVRRRGSLRRRAGGTRPRVPLPAGPLPRDRPGDDNLAEVAHARLLAPKDDAARAVLDEAFANLTRRAEVWEVLRDSLNTDEHHRGASEAEFRLTYPFSPVLVSTLRNLSSVMQRERTALKVMQRMLVDRRDTLTVDDLIPVGDAFDYIVEGGDPSTRTPQRCSNRLPSSTTPGCCPPCWRSIRSAGNNSRTIPLRYRPGSAHTNASRKPCCCRPSRRESQRCATSPRRGWPRSTTDPSGPSWPAANPASFSALCASGRRRTSRDQRLRRRQPGDPGAARRRRLPVDPGTHSRRR
ncbi:phage resistance PglY domain protein [Mycobacterium xenopi 3993]|nr:phage resistance PglY domain protein [Mycobacterium xenopi 3993]